ncbi:MAG: hypothetical protein QOE48_4896 [Mycobacterium sp.]|nr:hypothetical protein [Mycobacterium sp.]
MWSSTRLCRRRLSRVATQSWLHRTDSRVLLSAGGSGLACRFYVNRCRGERYGADCYLGRGSTSRDPAQSSTCVERTNSVPDTTDSPVPRFRANRRNEPPATVSRIRGPAETGGLPGRGRSERATNASVRCAGSRRRRCASGRPGRRRSGHSQSLTRLALMVVLRGLRAVGVGSSSSRCATPQRPTRPKIRVRLNRPGDSGVSGLTGAVHITDQRFCVCLTGISWRCEARRPASRRGADEAHGRAGGAVRPDPGRLVRLLADGVERGWGELRAPLAKSTLSHHLKTLRAAGVTRTREEGTRCFRAATTRRPGLAVPRPRRGRAGGGSSRRRR